MSICYRKGGGCGPYEMLSCGECPASKPSYAEKKKQGMTVYPSRSDHKHRHDSNADRIRAMTDEELAVLLEGCICPKDPCPDIDRDTPTDKQRCTKCWLDWLREEEHK